MMKELIQHELVCNNAHKTTSQLERTMMTKGKDTEGKRGTNKHEGTVAELSLDLFLVQGCF